MIELSRSACAYIDSNIFIYALEGSSNYQKAAAAIFTAAADMKVPLVASEYALAECLYGAARKRNADLYRQYRDFFSESAIDIFPVETPILEAAASLGPSPGLKLPDAIHVATALLAECDPFITNDRNIRGGPALRVALLDAL